MLFACKPGSPPTVRRFLDLRGIARRGRGQPIRVRIDRRQVVAWRRAAVTPAEMAARLGCAEWTVHDALYRLGFIQYRDSLRR
jgi:hypothetical protein